jgi:hypothetical protein
MGVTQRLQGWKEGVRELGYTGERRALALLPLCGFGLLYLILAANAQPGWGPAFVALSLAYLTSFFALAAGWFWARWFASGLGWSGFMVGVMALVMFGWIPPLAIYTGLHALIVAALLGPKMATRYELRPGWRERFAMDEFGVARLGKAVTRGASALPTLILWALAPREESLGMVGVGDGQVFALVLGLGLLVLGLVGLVRLRGYGIVALAGAAIAVSAGAALSLASLGGALPFGADLWAARGSLAPSPSPLVALAFVVAALAPWSGPMVRYLGRR